MKEEEAGPDPWKGGVGDDRTAAKRTADRRKCDRGVFAEGQKEGKYKLISLRVKTSLAGNTVSIS